MLVTKMYTFVVKRSYYLQGSIIPMTKTVLSGVKNALGEKVYPGVKCL